MLDAIIVMAVFIAKTLIMVIETNFRQPISFNWLMACQTMPVCMVTE